MQRRTRGLYYKTESSEILSSFPGMMEAAAPQDLPGPLWSPRRSLRISSDQSQQTACLGVEGRARWQPKRFCQHQQGRRHIPNRSEYADALVDTRCNYKARTGGARIRLGNDNLAFQVSVVKLSRVGLLLSPPERLVELLFPRPPTVHLFAGRWCRRRGGQHRD